MVTRTVLTHDHTRQFELSFPPGPHTMTGVSLGDYRLTGVTGTDTRA